MDEFYAHKQKQTGFLPSDRPKEWRAKSLEKLREGIMQKVEGNQLEGREGLFIFWIPILR